MTEESYFCHMIIPSKDYEKSKIFYKNVFNWKVQEQPRTSHIDILPQSGKGISAELNADEAVVVPSIHTTDIDAKLKLIEEFGGKILQGRTIIGNETQLESFALFEDSNGNKMCLYSEEKMNENEN